ncbi:hypothetical protein [Aerosakkonema funiforme]|uniref:hypothetical protein n=1 Tax=Aerosakkonema funiforme TaxID=1246630 RepID=UPI0035B7F2CD
MLEIIGDIWQPETWQRADRKNLTQITCNTRLWLCITTNGCIRKDGRAVMGAGIARQARDRYHGIERVLAEKLKRRGNQVNYLIRLIEYGNHAHLFSFPTKNNWRMNSPIELIEDSAKQLKYLWQRATQRYGEPPIVVLPQPGCSNGNLVWSSQVKPLLEIILDAPEFWIISPPGN